MHYEAKDFFNIASRFVGARPATAKTWWNGFFEVIVRELYTSGMVYLPKIGYFTLQHMDEKIQKQKDPDGNGVKYYVVPERDKPVFTPDDDFINDIKYDFPFEYLKSMLNRMEKEHVIEYNSSYGSTFSFYFSYSFEYSIVFVWCCSSRRIGF